MTAEKPTFSKGDQIGPYRIERLLGKGGMGEVYLAHEQPINRAVALKIIEPETASVEKNVKRFLTEGRALSLVKHPNVVTVYSVAQHENYYYISMEYVDGCSLEELCNNFSMPANEAVRLFLQMIDGLRALHAKNIVHRDLKPQNIFYQKDSTIKILDLGIAKVYGEENMHATTTGMVIGTVRYLAPEVAHGLPATFGSDIWSIGAIFYEILTGTQLIQGKTQMEALTRLSKFQMTWPYECLEWCEPEMQQIVTKMCMINPQARYKETDSLKADLQAFANKYPSKGLWKFDYVGNQATNGALVRQQLLQRGFSLPVAKRIMIDAMKQTHTQRLAKLSPDVTTKIDNTSKVTISNDAITQAVKTFQSSNSRLAGKRMLRKAAIGAAVAAIAVAMAVFLPKLRRPTMETADTGIKALEPVVPPPVKPAAPPVAPPPPAPVAVQPPAPAPAPQVVATPPPEPVKVEPEPAPKVAEVKAKPDTMSFQVPELIAMERLIVLKFPEGRSPASLDKPLNPPNFKWQQIDGAKSYTIEVAKDSDFEKIVWTQTLNKAAASWTQPKPGDYHWRIRAKSAGGKVSNYSDPGSFAVRVPAAVLPEKLNAKISGSASTAKSAKADLDLEWTEVPLAKRYRLQVTSVQSREQVVKEIVDGTHYKLRLPPGQYTAVITAVDASEKSINAESNPTKIDVALVLQMASPDLLSPPDAAVLEVSKTTPVPIVFLWNKSPEAEKYTIEVASDGQFKNVVATKSSSENRFILTRNLKAGSYYWRVKALGSKATSDWSKPRQIMAQSK